MDAKAVFDIREITKVYRTGDVAVHALRGASARLYEGEISVMLGPSGSGKSTFLNILGGLDKATSGQVLFDGMDITQASESELTDFRRKNVGFVFQFYNLIPSLTARENVALVTEISTDPMKPEDALDIVGLGERINHFPAQLSGGEQQRVAIARAIAKNPPCPALRRADRCAGFNNRTPGARCAHRHQHQAGHNHSDHHPQCRHSTVGPPGVLLC